MKKRLIVIVSILAFLAVAALVSCLMSRWWLVVRSWTVTSDRIQQGFDAVVISDLHGERFGKDNEKLIRRIQELDPDVIIMAGDMIGDDDSSDEELCALIKELIETAPVYYGYGNREIAYMEAGEDRETTFPQHLKEAGAVVLEKEFADVPAGSEMIRIGGMYEYAFGLDDKNSVASLPEPDKNFLTQFESTDSFRLMISHRSDSYIFGDASSYWNIDLVVSGHIHGGQVVLPFAGGLYGADQGFFPKYVHGLYNKDNIQLFVTSGLGSQKEIFPRMNNRPEIALLHIRSEG